MPIGMKTEPLERASLEKMASPSHHAKRDNSEQESCPFTWARSPENLLQQETYLALAVTFVVLRSLYFILPALLVCVQCAWRRHLQYTSLGGLWSLWEYPLTYLNRAIQLFNSLKEPCKRSNLQEGAMNARAWASKSLASVSIGDGSTSRVVASKWEESKLIFSPMAGPIFGTSQGLVAISVMSMRSLFYRMVLCLTTPHGVLCVGG